MHVALIECHILDYMCLPYDYGTITTLSDIA